MIANANAVASPFALLWPTFALVALILIVWSALAVRRVRHVRANPPTRATLVTGDAARRRFEPVRPPGDDLADPFETPVLFFALAPLLIMFRQVTTAQLLLAWIFVGLRAGHGFTHIATRNVRTRFRLHVASVAVLAAMWVGFFVDALAGARLYAIRETMVAQL